MKEFRVTLKVRNNLLLARREALGLRPREMAERIGISYGVYLRYEGLQAQPLRRSGLVREGKIRWKPTAIRIANHFRVLPEDLWPDVVLRVKNAIAEREYSAAQVGELVSGYSYHATLPPHEAYDQAEMAQQLNLVLETCLTAKERGIIRLRFFEGVSYEEIGATYEITRESVRHLEGKALRKLRHSSHSQYLKQFIGFPPNEAAKLRSVGTLLVWDGGTYERSKWWNALSDEDRYQHRSAWERAVQSAAHVTYDDVVYSPESPAPPESPVYFVACCRCLEAGPDGPTEPRARSAALEVGFCSAALRKVNQAPMGAFDEMLCPACCDYLDAEESVRILMGGLSSEERERHRQAQRQSYDTGKVVMLGLYKYTPDSIPIPEEAWFE